MPLEDHYAGDAAFSNYARAIRDHYVVGWDEWSGREQLIVACNGDEEVAVAVYRLADERSLSWLDERPPVLEGMTARECLTSDAGLHRLKEALLRTP